MRVRLLKKCFLDFLVKLAHNFNIIHEKFIIKVTVVSTSCNIGKILFIEKFCGNLKKHVSIAVEF